MGVQNQPNAIISWRFPQVARLAHQSPTQWQRVFFHDFTLNPYATTDGQPSVLKIIRLWLPCNVFGVLDPDFRLCLISSPRVAFLVQATGQVRWK